MKLYYNIIYSQYDDDDDDDVCVCVWLLSSMNKQAYNRVVFDMKIWLETWKRLDDVWFD